MSGSGKADSQKIAHILDAAAKIFLTHGFSGATTDMIQKEARVSKATLYSCFPSKEAMFTAVIENECASMARMIEAIQVSPGNIAKTLTEIAQAYLSVVLSPSGLALYRVTISDSPRFPALGRQFYLSAVQPITGAGVSRNWVLKSG